MRMEYACLRLMNSITPPGAKDLSSLGWCEPVAESRAIFLRRGFSQFWRRSLRITLMPYTLLSRTRCHFKLPIIVTEMGFGAFMAADRGPALYGRCWNGKRITVARGLRRLGQGHGYL